MATRPPGPVAMAVPGQRDGDLLSHLARIIPAYGIDLVFDVGANEGQFGGRLRQAGYPGEIHSFEPVAAIHERLVEAARGDDRWFAHRTALGSSSGTSSINVSKSTDFSSILEANAYGRATFKGMRTDEQEEIALARLDEHPAGRLALEGRRALLKIDTQGYDLKVFDGAKGILDRVCCLVSELSLIPIYEGMPAFLDMLALYRDAGFAVSGIYPVSRDKKTLALIEADCVLVRSALFEGKSFAARSGQPVGVGGDHRG